MQIFITKLCMVMTVRYAVAILERLITFFTRPKHRYLLLVVMK